jgi:hypothetical protein
MAAMEGSPSGEPDKITVGEARLKEGAGSLQFPFRLHQVLAETEENGKSSIISWSPDGHSFRVHERASFESMIMASYFSSSRYKSFQRNLNVWGYELITEGISKGGYRHKHFVKGKPELCYNMSRQSIKGDAGPNITSTVSQQSPHLQTGKRPPQTNPRYLDQLAEQPAATQARLNMTATLPLLLSTGSNQRGSATMSKIRNSTTFPRTLHHILSQQENKDLICWMHHGRSFQVVDPVKFQQLIIPSYFGCSDYGSFVRQLEEYGFAKGSGRTVRDVEIYYHDVSRSKCTDSISKLYWYHALCYLY